MEANDFVSVEHVIAQVKRRVNDREGHAGFTPGWYVSRVADAIQEISIDTFWQVITRDFKFPSETFALPIPKNGFNIREIYLFNCGCGVVVSDNCSCDSDCACSNSACECCTPGTSANVWWKVNYNNKGMGPVGTSRIRERGRGQQDAYTFPHGNMGGGINSGFSSSAASRRTYYANVQNGMIMFGDPCSSYNKVRIVYNGMGMEIGDTPIVPRFFERYVMYYVVEEFYAAKTAENPRTFRGLWHDHLALREKEESKARKRIKSMSAFERTSIYEYISSMIHK